MKASSKVGLLAVVALLATAAVATSAQAATFNPDNTAVSGTSSNFTLTYGAATIECASVTLEGNTGLDSDRLTNLALTFTDGCAFAGVGPATADCVGTVTVIADPDADDTGTGELDEGFQCNFSTAVCTVTVAGPQTTQPKNTVLDEANDVLSIDWEVQANRTGSPTCGPPSGTMRITADFAMTPPELTIDP
jgi:hypothetical protein